MLHSLTQGRSKSLTHIDTLDPGMLVTSPPSSSSSSHRIKDLAEGGDYHCRSSETDTMTTTTASQPHRQLSSSGGSQDRLLTVPNPSSSCTPTAPASTPVPSSSSGMTSVCSPIPPPTIPVVNNPGNTTTAVSPTDPALRRRRLSNLYKVIKRG